MTQQTSQDASPIETRNLSRAAQQNSQRADPGQAPTAPRSENLLPADDADTAADDGRYEVAEEVNLDQQSDALRRVGQAPRAIAPDDDATS